MEIMLVPFYEVIDNEDLQILSDHTDNRIGCCCEESSCSVALNAALKDFPDDPKEAFLEFYGSYLFFLTHKQAEELFNPLLSQPLENMNALLTHGIPEEPNLWQIDLAQWRIKIGK
jgi:hypothetical protein